MTWTHEHLKCKQWTGQRASFIQEKLDGFHLTLFKQDDQSVIAFGRDLRPDLEYGARWPHLRDMYWWKHFASVAPSKTSIVGELFVPGKPASEVSRVLASATERLLFRAFAVPYWAGALRDSMGLDWARDRAGSVGLEFADYAEYRNQSREVLLAAAKKRGIEGWVLKEANWRGWYKLKEENTVDCIVTGIKEGDGKYLGGIGALIVSVYRDGQCVEIANCSGMTDAERDQMLLDEDELVGRVCEVKYQYVGSKGRLRHPRFMRWRPDKPAVECTWEQLQCEP